MSYSVSGQAAPTPSRRSARLASMGPSNASVDQSIAATSATPGRASTRRNRTLPKLKANQSNAYGASGRLGAAEALTISQTGFAQAFDAQRETAVARDEKHRQESEARASQRSSPRANSIGQSEQNSPPRGHQSPSPSEGQSLPSARPGVNGREITEIDSTSVSNNDTSKSFGFVHEAGLTEQPANGTHRPALGIRATQVGRDAGLTSGYRRGNIAVQRPVAGINPVQPTRVAPAGDAPVLAAQGGQPGGEEHQEIRRGDGKYTNWILWIFIGLAIVAGFLGFSALSASKGSSASIPQFFDAVGARISYSWEGVIHWIEPPPAKPAELPIGSGVYNASEDEDIVRDPSARGYVTNFARITQLERFTRALSARLDAFIPATTVVTRNRDGGLEVPDEFWRALVGKGAEELESADWEKFFAKNDKLAELLLHSPVEGKEVVSRDELLSLIEKKYRDNAERVEKLVETAVSSIKKEVAQAINKEITSARDVVQQRAARQVIEQIRVQSLALTALETMATLDHRKINFFAPGNGATVDRYLTSSTYNPHSDRFSLFSARKPPSTALQRWSEPGDCWCAAPDHGKKGLAQLSVSLGQKMFPRQVTVEHLPKLASVNIASAPKEVELWVPLDSEQVDSVVDCGPGPAGHTCLGKFEYNIDGPVHAQTFNLDGATFVPIDKAVVRVTSNHGADYTCLYRLRLHGDLVGDNE